MLACTSHCTHNSSLNICIRVYLSASYTARLTMSFITVVYLMCILVYSLVQATQTCSNIEMRKAAVNEVLTHIGCEDYNCGKFPYIHFISE